MNQKAKTNLANPQQVLSDYLDALLSEVEPLTVTEAPVAETLAELVSEIPQPETPPSVGIAEPVTQVVPVPTVLEESVVEANKTLLANELQILLFKVAGIMLAVPLEGLSGILEWSAEITPMPNRSAWFLGLLAERETQIKVIDTAMLVVPSNFRSGHSVDDFEKIILIGDGEWGLACDEVCEVITLKRDQVRWRGESSKRPWLAGTVIDHMCALLDTDKFAGLLSSDKLVPAG